MRLLFFLLLLIPSAFYAWKNADMPEFGKLHDDGILFVSAKEHRHGRRFPHPQPAGASPRKRSIRCCIRSIYR